MDLRNLAIPEAVCVIETVICRQCQLRQPAAAIKCTFSNINTPHLIRQRRLTDCRTTIKTLRAYRSRLHRERLRLFALLIPIPSLISIIPRINQADIILSRMSMGHSIQDPPGIIIRIHKKLQKLQSGIIDRSSKENLVIDKINRLIDILLLRDRDKGHLLYLSDKGTIIRLPFLPLRIRIQLADFILHIHKLCPKIPIDAGILLQVIERIHHLGRQDGTEYFFEKALRDIPAARLHQRL